MHSTISVHLEGDVEVRKYVSTTDFIGTPYAALSICQGLNDVSFFTKTENVDQFVDAICTAAYGTSYSELAQSYDESEKENEDKDAYIEKLEKELDELKESLSAPENTADDHELY